MKILKITYFDFEEPFISEEYEVENVSYDEQTKCLTVDVINNDGNRVITSFPITNLRKFSVTVLEREL